MKIVLIIIVGLFVLGMLSGIAMYNRFIKGRNSVEEAYSTMDVCLKKRFDLIPNLVSTVKGYAEHEKEVLTSVTAARTEVANSKTPEGKMEAEAGLTQALGKLFAVAEAYPDLKANENFLDLQRQLGEIETEIANARRYYNAVVKDFNTSIQMFPASIIANMTGFNRYPMFEVNSEAEKEPVQVQF